MKFKLTKASDWDFDCEIEINTLEELITFIKEEGSIILYEDMIMIYDSYVE